MTDQMQSEIAELSQKIDEIEDPRQCFAIVQERVRKYRQLGLQVPPELMRLERSLAAECLNESQGR